MAIPGFQSSRSSREGPAALRTRTANRAENRVSGLMSDTSPGAIEPMDLDRDLDGILAVDAASFANPWTRDMFVWEARNSDVARLYVYRVEGRVIAYCAVWHIFEDLHINNLAVLPDWRRRGIAGQLLSHALTRARAAGARRATLEVRASNLAARRLYETFGFRPAGVRKHYYTNPNEDAVILWCEMEQ
jgi:ribosomal-protein-alanine N-acetyltransferase